MKTRRQFGHHGHFTVRTTRRAERGNALIIAMVFVLVMSVLLTAILGYAQTNARVSQDLIEQRNLNYRVDGGLEAAINWAKDVPTVGRDPLLYPGDQTTTPCVYKVPASDGVPEVTVSCAAESGSDSGRGPDGGTYPANAITTLGQRTTINTANANKNFDACGGDPVEEGIRSWADGLPPSVGATTCDTSRSVTNQPLSVRGPVASASSIKLDASLMRLYPKQDGTASRASTVGSGTCTPTGKVLLGSTSNTACLTNQAAPTDPNYTHRPINTTVRSVPATCSGSGVTTFEPGTYSSAAALSNLFAHPSCKDKWVWFKPGVYYFNFTDALTAQPIRCGPNAATDYSKFGESNAHEWCVGRKHLTNSPGGTTNGGTNNVTIIGGTPFNWDPATEGQPAASVAFPQSVSKTNPYGGNCDPGKPGVQFIFGGDSRLYVSDGNVELCAGRDPDNPNAPRIAVYQIKAQSTVGTTPTSPTATCPQGGLRYSCVSNVASAQAIDGQLATYDYKVGCSFGDIVCTRDAGTIRVPFSSYTVPPGNQVQQVILRARYDTNANDYLCTPDSGFRGIIQTILVGGLGFGCTAPRVSIIGADGPQAGNCQNSTNILPATTQMRTVSVDITPCFAASGAGLQNFAIQFTARAQTFYCGVTVIFDFDTCTRWQDQIDGFEVDVILTPSSPSAERPADGCMVAKPNYNDGIGENDCAVLKVDQIGSTTTAANVAPEPNEWVGRLSVKGTVYTPSSAVDYSDKFAKYPLFERGLIARHLRIGSYRYIGSPELSCTANCPPQSMAADIDPSPFVFEREVTFTACTQAATGDQNVCSAAEGDKIRGKVKVVFHVTPDANPTQAGAQPAANKPEVMTWETLR